MDRLNHKSCVRTQTFKCFPQSVYYVCVCRVEDIQYTSITYFYFFIIIIMLPYTYARASIANLITYKTTEENHILQWLFESSVFFFFFFFPSFIQLVSFNWWYRL